MKTLYKVLFTSFLSLTSMYAFDFRANGVGGDLSSSQSVITINGEAYTLLPFSYVNKKVDESSIGADYTVLIGEVNGIKVSPVKVSQDYRNQALVIKVYKSLDKFDETTYVTQSEEIFLDESYEHYTIDIY